MWTSKLLGAGLKQALLCRGGCVRRLATEKPFAKCRVAVINGSDHVGREFASVFLDNGARNVVLVGTAGDDAICSFIEKYGCERVEFRQMDATKKASVEAMFKGVLGSYGQLDYLVNNLNYFSIDNFPHMISYNAYGLVLSTFLGLKNMKSDVREIAGTMINVGNISGVEPFYPVPAYSGTNHFLVQLTKSVSHTFFHSKTNVRVMALLVDWFCGQNDVKDAEDCVIKELGNLAAEAEKIVCCEDKPICQSVGAALHQVIREGKNGDIFAANGIETVKLASYDKNQLVCKES